MFVAVSIFEVANGMAEEVKKAFVSRPHLVDAAAGFLEMKVLSPQENLNEIWVTTFWNEESNYQDWYKNHMKESHQGIPKGLKLVPESTKVRFFQQVTN
ncbi:antibiotic biosynthesis monooxygenase family protein [Pontibacter sp. MBLB2868]|uniref:antibiotic biosynthesis monooxygenase family protein n=1 Tax=Pontibacter sp. MBLB2868 TaxID=3451555 RepID=UPI003F753EC1